MKRGAVIQLTLEQVASRARYLSGPGCVTGYYLLHDHNGGKDPTAPDPFDRWSKPGSTFVNITADCIGGAAWCGGFDRYQPDRFAHIYGGWINTDSMRQDAAGPALCFERLDRPEPGCFVVFASGAGGHKVGHIGTVVGVPLEWDARELECWKALEVVDVASRIGRANMLTTGVGWWNKQSWFIRSRMA